MSGSLHLGKSIYVEKLTSKLEEDPPEKLWMVRACHLYDDEYSDCTSVRGRFQQYFVFGKFQDCNQWMNDYNNCLKWKNTADKAVVEEIIKSEELRRHERLDPHFNNPVWEDRTEPPTDWNSPLPPLLAERQKNTFLEIKSKEMREGQPLKPLKTCTIL